MTNAGSFVFVAMELGRERESEERGERGNAQI